MSSKAGLIQNLQALRRRSALRAARALLISTGLAAALPA